MKLYLPNKFLCVKNSAILSDKSGKIKIKKNGRMLILKHKEKAYGGTSVKMDVISFQDHEKIN